LLLVVINARFDVDELDATDEAEEGRGGVMLSYEEGAGAAAEPADGGFATGAAAAAADNDDAAGT